MRIIKYTFFLLIVSCGSLNFRLPVNFLTYVEHSIRSIASNPNNAFLNLSSTLKRIEFVENKLSPLVSSGNNIILGKNDKNSFGVNDVIDGKIGADLDRLEQVFNESVQEMFIIKQELVWLMKSRFDKVKFFDFSKEDRSKAYLKLLSSESKTVQEQKKYLSTLAQLHYLYVLIAHTIDEVDRDRFLKADFHFGDLKGLDLITHEAFVKNVTSGRETEISRMTLPVDIQNNRLAVLGLKSDKAIIEEFGQDGKLKVRKDYEDFYDDYLNRSETYKERILSLKFNPSSYANDYISIGVDHEDKFLMEFMVLKDVKNAKQMMKANQLISIREMILNSWSVQRLKDGNQGLGIQACGNNGFLSFKVWGNNSTRTTSDIYYNKKIWNNDFYFNHLNLISKKINELLYEPIYLGSLPDYSLKVKPELVARNYAIMLAEIILYSGSLPIKMPAKLAEMLKGPKFDNGYATSDDPLGEIEGNFEAFHALVEEVNNLDYDSLAFKKILFSDDNYDIDYVSNILALESYQIKAKGLVKYLMRVFTEEIEPVKKYGMYKEYEITRKDSRKLKKYFERVIDIKFGKPWIENVKPRIKKLLSSVYENQYLRNKEDKINTLHLSLSRNFKKAVTLNDYYNKINGAPRSIDELISSDLDPSFPVSSSLPVIKYEQVVSFLEYLAREDLGGNFGLAAIRSVAVPFNIRSEFSEIVLNKFKNSSFIKSVPSRDDLQPYSLEGKSESQIAQEQVKYDLAWDKVERDISDESWRIVKESVYELEQRYPISNSEYNKVYSEFHLKGETSDMSPSQKEGYLKVDELYKDSKLKSFCDKDLTIYEDQNVICNQNLSCDSYEKCSDEVLSKKFKGNDKIFSVYTNYNEAVRNAFAARSIRKFFLIKTPQDENKFSLNMTLQKYLSSNFLDEMVEFEPFFRTKFKTTTWVGLGKTASKVDEEVSFLKLMSNVVRENKVIPSRKIVREHLDFPLNNSTFISSEKVLQSFCKADYRNFETGESISDPDLKNLYEKSKNVRDVLIRISKSNTAKIKDDVDKTFIPFRYYLRQYSMYIGVGLIAGIGVGFLLGLVGVTALSTVLGSSLVLNTTGVFYLIFGLYEILYVSTALSPALDVQKRLMSAQNLRSTPNIKMSEVVNLSEYKQIEDELSEAMFDAKMSLLFFANDIMVFKLLYRNFQVKRFIPQLKHLKKIKVSPRFTEELSRLKHIRDNAGNLKKAMIDIKQVYLSKGIKKLKLTQNELNNYVFDTIRKAITDKNLKYVVNRPHLDGLQSSSKNMLHFLTSLNKRLDRKMYKIIKGRFAISTSKGNQLIRKGHEFMEVLNSGDGTKYAKVLRDEFAKSLDDLERVYIGRSQKLKAENFESAEFSDDFTYAIKQYFYALEHFNGAPELSKKIKQISSYRFDKEINAIVELKKYHKEMIDLLLENKSGTQIYDSWFKILNEINRKSPASKIKTIVDDAIMRKSPGEFAFEMYFETRWKSFKFDFMKKIPNSFIDSIHADLDNVAIIKETVKSYYQSNKPSKVSKFTRSVYELVRGYFRKYSSRYEAGAYNVNVEPGDEVIDYTLNNDKSTDFDLIDNNL